MLQSLMNCKLLLSRYRNPEAGRALELTEVTVLKSLSTPLDGLTESLGDQAVFLLGTGSALIELLFWQNLSCKLTSFKIKLHEQLIPILNFETVSLDHYVNGVESWH